MASLSSEYLRVMSPSADTRDRRDARGTPTVRLTGLLLLLSNVPAGPGARGSRPARVHQPVRAQVVSGRKHVSVLAVEPVGQYAIR